MHSDPGRSPRPCFWALGIDWEPVVSDAYGTLPPWWVGYVCSLLGWEYLLTAETLGRSHREEFPSA